MCFGCFGKPDDAWIYTAATVLVVGLEGSGKSLLLQRLPDLAKPPSRGCHSISSSAVAPADLATMPTIGTELLKLKPLKGLLPKGLILREVGGQMQPMWHHYYAEAAAVLFVVDVAASSAIAEAGMELLDLLQHPQLQYKPLCVVLNKCDQPGALSRGQLDAVLRLQGLLLQHPERLQLLTVSGMTGSGLTQLMQWLAAAAAAGTAGSEKLTAGVRVCQQGAQQKQPVPNRH